MKASGQPGCFRNPLLWLEEGETRLGVNLRGAEPVSWQVGGRELLWNGDPAWWERSAPVLFPVVGASRHGAITVGGKEYPVPLHGFAKDSLFDVVRQTSNSVHLRLRDNAESAGMFPFPFQLDIDMTLAGKRWTIGYEVSNPGRSSLPYAIGFHPGFRWQSDCGEILFDHEESAQVPCIAEGGLLARRMRSLAMHGKKLALTKGLFNEGALLFLNVRSRGMTLQDGTGQSIRMQTEGFRHFAIWSRQEAPFISLEVLNGHADWEDADGDLFQRDGMVRLYSGETRKHSISLAHF